MPRLLATVAQLRTRMNASGGAVDEQLLKELLESASNRIEEETGREFLPAPTLLDSAGDPIDPVPGPVERTVQAHRSRWCQAQDCRSFTSVVADGIDVTAEVRLVRKRHDHPAHAMVLPQLAQTVVITGHFGWAEVPAAVRDATLGWAARAYYEHRARMSDGQADPDGGGFVTYFRQVPPFVSGVLDSYTVAGL